MVVMEAVMVRLPFAAGRGKGSLLHTLVESDVPVETFGSSTVRAIIDYKWRRFAKRQIYTKSLIYLIYVLLFTVRVWRHVWCMTRHRSIHFDPSRCSSAAF